MTDKTKEGLMAWGQTVFNVIASIVLAFAGWTGSQTIQNQKELAEIKGTMITAKDHLAVWKEISEVRQRAATLPDRADVSAIDERQRQILERLARIEAAVTNGRN